MYKLSQELLTDGNPIRCMSYNSNSATLYTGSESGIISTIHLPTHSVQIYNNNTDKNQNELRHDHHITALISNETYFITGCKDSNIRVFDIKSRKRLFLLHGHEKPVTSLSFLEFYNTIDDDNNCTMYFYLSRR